MTLALTAVGTATPAAQASSNDPPGGAYTGCPRGAVCVYPDADWNGGNPSYIFFSYGAHRIYNQYGEHRIFNNQTGGAGATLCATSHGTSCRIGVLAGGYRDLDLTPINSIRLFE
ncbi:hypothetical protein EXU48_20300 [Occultella glacieicola]|uniref:Peptidase inhibitor family I36 n=1 Tax=Occultella glacieicola TaxID=2518684 RepID=A0ABY2DYN7_9MICO|nr:hypothetical protein EXU48_20300 [Occultella glacieicola]